MSNFKALIEETKLLESRAVVQRERDKAYLMELTVENLLFPHYFESGLSGSLNYRVKTHGGWESTTSHVRGMFVGHWLSAAARIVNETGDMQLKAKADFIVDEIARCQEQNGGGWAFPIPEKYLYSIKAGKNFWAPQYVCHKNMMGLLEMHLYAGNQKALEIVKLCADWFYTFTNDVTRENMTNMMDIQETGALMEFWADLYSVTNDEKHLELMRRYERPTFFEPVLRGEDVLTNVHANSTIPEIHGCARAYEVTGEERYRKVVENYWDLAVRQRGTYASGGETCGEIWSPIHKQQNRLGESNQEHCVVYNMIRLADYLYRWTGQAEYADYIEMNIHNGLFAQGFWESRGRETFCEPVEKETGIVTYYLPLAAGSTKKWGGKTEDFWCCHGTVVQANARYREYIYYQNENKINIAQYMPSKLKTKINGIDFAIEQTETNLTGKKLSLSKDEYILDQKPEFMSYTFKIHAENNVNAALSFRLPWWLNSSALIYVNDEKINFEMKDSYAIVEKHWRDDTVVIILPKRIHTFQLGEEEGTVAFLDGPVLLAGLIEEQRVIYGNIDKPETIIRIHNEREWNNWLACYETVGQEQNFPLVPINQIGKEVYTVYFPVRNKCDS